MTVLLLVEGPSDRSALPILARKLRSGVRFIARAVGKGDLLSASKVEVHLYAAVVLQRDIDKALLCIDSECTPIPETRVRIDAVVQEVAQQFPRLIVRAVVVDHSLEGWLLADRQALAEFLGTPEGQLRYGDPENECRPAIVMERVFNRARRDFTKTGALPTLAQRVDVRQIAQGSPTFEAFRQALVQG